MPTRPVRVNLLEDLAGGEDGGVVELEAVRLDANEVVVIPFTADATPVDLHYCDDPEVRGYVHCNGRDCTLCRAGRGREERRLLPVYAPATGAFAVLPISPSRRPGALLPQVLAALGSGRRVALLIRKPDRAKFTVRVVELTDAMDDGAEAVAAFLPRWEAGNSDLSAIYPRLANRDMAEIASVAAILKFQGKGGDA